MRKYSINLSANGEHIMDGLQELEAENIQLKADKEALEERLMIAENTILAIMDLI